MIDLKQIDEALNFHIKLRTFPIAIRMCTSGEEIPQEAKLPLRDLGVKINTCEGIAMARYYGYTVAIRKEDENCSAGALFLGFLPFKRAHLEGNIQYPPCTTKEALAKNAQAMKNDSLEYGKYEYMLLAPLKNAAFEPHVILLYGNPAQIGRLVVGAFSQTGEPLVSRTRGSGSCSNITRTMIEDECTPNLPGLSDMRIAGCPDYEANFIMPLSKIEKTIEGLVATQKMGYRYPFAPYLKSRRQVEFPEEEQFSIQFKKFLEGIWEEGE